MNNHAAKLIGLITAALTLAVFTPTSVIANDYDTTDINMYGTYAKGQEKAIRQISHYFCFGGTPTQRSGALKGLARSEKGMLHQGASYLDENLFYGHLAEGLSPSQYSEFGWRVFNKKMTQLGIRIDKPSRVFQGSYTIYKKGEPSRPAIIKFSSY